MVDEPSGLETSDFRAAYTSGLGTSDFGLITSGLRTSDIGLATAAKQLAATNNTFNMFFALSGL